MAKIMNVDYEAMPNQAKQMRAQGKELNNELVGAYKKYQICTIAGMEKDIIH